MCEPWYQMTGPTETEVKDILMKKYPSYERYIKLAMEKEIEKYSGYGSWRGFYTFTEKSLCDTIDSYIKKKEKPQESIEEKANNDLKQIMEWINSRDDKDYIYNMFIKGPPENKGFMWCDKEGGRRKWWTEKESKGLKDVTQYVLNLGWDSSGYGLFMRKLQNHIINKSL